MALGTDVPGLPRAHLEAARAALEGHDAVLGPAEDGGYYLIGLRRCPPGIFDGIPWSCDQTLSKTRKRLESLGMNVAESLRYFDIDRPEDLLKLERRRQSGDLHAPTTELTLRELNRFSR